MNLSITAIIPTYNYGHFVGHAIDSVLNQTRPPQEILVIDDGSTDDTATRVAAYGDRVRYIRQKNSGTGAARNTGIRHAHGEWLAFLDSDDDWHPRKLECQQRVIAQHPDVGLVATTCYLIGEERRNPGAGQMLESMADVEEISLALLLQATVFCPSSAIIRAACLRTVGLFDEDIQGVEDLAMWWRFAASFPVLKLRGQLTGYYDHPQSVSKNYSAMLANQKTALARSFAILPPLREHRLLRNLARARIHAEAAWMRYAMNNRRKAFTELACSVINHPCALRESTMQKARWRRLRLAVRFTKPLRPDAG